MSILLEGCWKQDSRKDEQFPVNPCIFRRSDKQRSCSGGRDQATVKIWGHLEHRGGRSTKMNGNCTFPFICRSWAPRGELEGGTTSRGKRGRSRREWRWFRAISTYDLAVASILSSGCCLKKKVRGLNAKHLFNFMFNVYNAISITYEVEIWRFQIRWNRGDEIFAMTLTTFNSEQVENLGNFYHLN